MSNPSYSNAQTICTSEQLASSLTSGIHCLTRGESLGLVAITMAAYMSLVAVFIMFILIARNVYREWRQTRQLRLFQIPMDVYMVSLLSADLLQALGGSMEVKWINDGIVRPGSLCTAQGFLQNLGQSAIAMTTLIITVYTFVTIWWRSPVLHSLKTASVLVILVWLYLLLSIGISVATLKEPPFYVPTPYWCWISNKYLTQRIVIQNAWLWLAFATCIFYIPLWSWSEGYVTTDQETWWKFDVHTRRARNVQTSRLMLIGALSYVVPVLPTSLSRWIQTIQGDDKPFGMLKAQFIVFGIFQLSGLIDVIVFRLTRVGVLLFAPPQLGPGPDELPMDEIGDHDDVILQHPADGIPEHHAEGRGLIYRIAIIGLLAVWAGANIGDGILIKYYIRSATSPNPHTIFNKSNSRWIALFVMLYIGGFFLGVINLGVCWIFYVKFHTWFHNARRQREEIRTPRTFTILWYTVITLGFFPVVALVLGPFFGPAASLRPSQSFAYKYGCDDYVGEIILDGPAFNAPNDATLYASFSFGQDGVRSLYDYEMKIDAQDTNIWYLQLVTVPAQFYPLVQNVTFELANNSFTAYCATSPNASLDTINSCINGSFDLAGHLTVSTTNSSTNVTTVLKSIDAPWSYTDDAPNYILKTVQPNGSLGKKIVARSDVTQPGQCSTLKLCAADPPGGDILAVVGLTLMEQAVYSRYCTTPNSS